MESEKEKVIGASMTEITGWPIAVFAYLIYKACVALITGKTRLRTNLTVHK